MWAIFLEWPSSMWKKALELDLFWKEAYKNQWQTGKMKTKTKDLGKHLIPNENSHERETPSVFITLS